MSDSRSVWERFAAGLKDMASASRDGVLFLLFLLLLLAPKQMHDRLVLMGLTEGDILGFKWQAEIESSAEETKMAGQAVSTARDQYKTLVEQLDRLERSAPADAGPQLLSEIRSQAKASQKSLSNADARLKETLFAQQAIVREFEPAAVVDSGWIFVGLANEEKSAWADRPQTTLQVAAPTALTGRLTVADGVYLREEALGGERSAAPIVTVAKTGEIVEVISAPEFVHAAKGGWFVWVKVRRAP